MKKSSVRFIAAIFTLALSSGVVTATGCGGSSISKLCEDVCACERCTSNDLQTCQNKGSAAADAADAAGCSGQFAEAVACSSSHVSCQDAHALTDGCSAELTALSKCSATLSVFGKNACEIAADQVSAYLASCPKPPTAVSTTGGGGQVACTDTVGVLLACRVKAIVEAPCDCLGAGDANKCSQEQLKTFSDALSLCK